MPKKSAAAAPPRADLKTTALRVWQWSKTSRLVHFALLWLAAFMVLLSFFLAKFMLRYNYLETFPREIIFPIALHAVTALVAAAIIYFIKKPRLLAGKLASVTLLSLLWVGYDDRLMKVVEIMRAWLPLLPEPDRDVPIISLVFIALLVCLALLLGRGVERLVQKHDQLEPKNIVMGIFVLLGLLLIGQAMPASKALSQVIKESKTVPAALQSPQPTTTQAASNPDIYYIVLDRYANNKVLGEQFNYDNQPFTTFLQDKGFKVNQEAFSNYPFTSISISSTLNAQYTKDFVTPFKNQPVQSHTLYHNLIQQSSVIKALQTQGYQYHLVGSTYGATNKGPIAQDDYMYNYKLDILGRSKRLRGLENAEFIQSPWYRFAKMPWIKWWPVNLEEFDYINYVKEQLGVLQKLANSETQGGRFIFSHILVPHDPFNFNADGSISPYKGTDSFGKTIKQKYTDQVTFINSQVQQLVADITAKSNGEAVVILNADEGPYPNDMNLTTMKDPGNYIAFENGALKGDMRAWPTDWLQMKFGILQAVHIPRATEEDMAHLSSVNAFRIILNRYADFSMDYLPQCHFVFSQGTHMEYRYSDITDKLDGETSDYCRSLETVPADQQ